MFQRKLLPNGHLLVPRCTRIEGLHVDGLVEIGPDDPEYEDGRSASATKTERRLTIMCVVESSSL